MLGIMPDKAALKARIRTRVAAMLAAGLEAEVKALVASYGWDNEAMSGIGYREFKPYFAKKATIGQVEQAIVRDSMQYVKRQYTWFKRNPFIQWFPDAESAYRTLVPSEHKTVTD
jgi:tRNA dimethylallyltransferase